MTASWNGAQVVGNRLLVQPAAPGKPGVVAKSVGTRKAKSPRCGSLNEFGVGIAEAGQHGW